MLAFFVVVAANNIFHLDVHYVCYRRYINFIIIIIIIIVVRYDSNEYVKIAV